MRSHSPDTRDLVRRNRDSKPSATDQDRAVGIALRNHLCGFDGRVRVRGLIASGQDADVEHFGYARVFLEVCFESSAVAQAGVVAAEDNGHSLCGAHGRDVVVVKGLDGKGSKLASIATNSSRIHLNRFSLCNVRHLRPFRCVLGVVARDRGLASCGVGFADVCDFHFACGVVGDFLVQVLVSDVEVGCKLDFAVGRRHGGRMTGNGGTYLDGSDKCGRLPRVSLVCLFLSRLNPNGIPERGVARWFRQLGAGCPVGKSDGLVVLSGFDVDG
jgi:hypothetical protein